MNPDPAIDAGPDPQAAIRRQIEAFEWEYREDGGEIPLFNADSVAAAVVDRAGRLVAASPAFTAIGAQRHIDADYLARALKGAPPGTVAVDIDADDGIADTAIFAYALAAHTGAWRLPPQLREAAQRHPGHAVVLTSQVARASAPLAGACRAYGLSGLQTRVVTETIRTGQVKAAAAAVGVSFHTAREALATAMKRARVSRLPALVSRLTSQAFGIMPQAGAADVLQDVWGLSTRQAAVAALIADGATRAGVAQTLATSEAVVRKELERVHEILRVSSAAELARKVVEAEALRWLTAATGGDIGFVEPDIEPLRFVLRPDGRRIAVSDYGPASGVPILVAHSSTSSRFVARSLLRALQAEGYRPIAIDRPGFGLTDEVAGARIGAHDPFATAAADAVVVLDAFRIRRTDLVARGAAQFVLALERAAPGRLRRVVMVNPDPPMRESGDGIGGTSPMKQAYIRNPAVIRLTAPFLTRQADFAFVARKLREGARSSPPDAEALRDVDLVRDYFRALRPFATGRIAGYINEQTAFARAPGPDPLAGTNRWQVLVSAYDFLHDPSTVAAYWKRVLPDADVRLAPDTGRYLAFSHPHLVVEALHAAAATSGP